MIRTAPASACSGLCSAGSRVGWRGGTMTSATVPQSRGVRQELLQPDTASNPPAPSRPSVTPRCGSCATSSSGTRRSSSPTTCSSTSSANGAHPGSRGNAMARRTAVLWERPWSCTHEEHREGLFELASTYLLAPPEATRSSTCRPTMCTVRFDCLGRRYPPGWCSGRGHDRPGRHRPDRRTCTWPWPARRALLHRGRLRARGCRAAGCGVSGTPPSPEVAAPWRVKP